MGARQSLYTICRARKQNTPTCSEVIHIVVCRVRPRDRGRDGRRDGGRVRPRLEPLDETEFGGVVEGGVLGPKPLKLVFGVERHL
jgi:hypothetical protein